MGKSVEYCLSKGYDQKMAEYFASGRRRITEVVPNDNFTLTLTFDKGEKRLFNVAPLLQDGTVFAPFREWNNFRRVYLDECHSVSWDIDPAVDSSVVWNNKVDLCPDICYVDSIPLTGGGTHVWGLFRNYRPDRHLFQLFAIFNCTHPKRNCQNLAKRIDVTP